MANTFLKADKIAATALGVLEREIVLPALVWRNAGGNFQGAFGDTISLRVPARTTARSRQLRGARPTEGDNPANAPAGIITMDSLTETKVDVTLDEEVYNAIPITDEELTLDIVDFGPQVLQPQVRAVAEGLENKLAEEMTGASYATVLTLEEDQDPYEVFIDARKALNVANVPMNDRIAVVGAELEARILKSEHLSHADKSGDNTALRDAEIGRYAGLPRIYTSNALPEDVGFVFHRTAYVMSLQAPVVPAGVTYGSSQSFESLAMRWIRDYDFRNVQDRSLVGTYVGTNIVADGPEVEGDPTFVRAVKIELAESSSAASSSS